jgi:hypothetical protein
MLARTPRSPNRPVFGFLLYSAVKIVTVMFFGTTETDFSRFPA